MTIGHNRLKTFCASPLASISIKPTRRDWTILSGASSTICWIGVRNASYNDRDMVMKPDLPLTKGFLERRQDFQRYNEQIGLKRSSISSRLIRPLERALSGQVEQMLPELAGTLAMLAGETIKVIHPDMENPESATWDKVFTVMDVLLLSLRQRLMVMVCVRTSHSRALQS